MNKQEGIPALGYEVWVFGSSLRVLANGGQAGFTDLLEVWDDKVRRRDGVRTFRTRSMMQEVIVTSDVAMMQDILQRRPAEFYRNVSYFGTFLPSLTSVEGEVWKKTRKIMVKFLHANLDAWEGIIERNLVSCIEKYIADGPVDVSRFTAEFTQRSFQEVLFKNKDLSTLTETRPFVRLMRALQFHFLNESFPFTSRDERKRNQVYDLFLGLERYDWTEKLLSDLGDQAGFASAVFTELTALKYNTAFHIGRVLIDLATRDASFQERIRKELASPGDSTDDDSFTKACIMESLRFNTPVPVLGMSNFAEYEFGGNVFKPNTLFYLLLGKASKESAINDRFPANEFQPSRFLDEATGEFNASASKTLTFGHGPRVCPGKQVDLMYVKMVLRKLLPAYRITVPEDFKDPEIKTTFIFKYLSPFTLTFTAIPEGMNE